MEKKATINPNKDSTATTNVKTAETKSTSETVSQPTNEIPMTNVVVMQKGDYTVHVNFF
jgi:hypothetical protein